MGPPPDEPKDFIQNVLEPIVNSIKSQQRVMIHCRGGVGRAGTVAVCLMLYLNLVNKSKKAI